MIEMDGDVLVYREKPLPVWMRIFVVILGIGIATVIPTPFIIHIDWSTPSPMFLLGVPCIILPIILGCFFVFVGFASASELRLDPVTRTAQRRMRGPLLNRIERFALADVGAPRVFMRESSEDGPYPILSLALPKGKIEIASFRDQAEAHAWAERMRSILAA